jgi:acyl-CoA reductase-like NAD-dependent aldehyde dehydrogenase
MSNGHPKRAHELIKDPVLGDLASATNAVECDLYMVQVPTEDTDSWLRRTIRDAEAVAQAARALLEKRAESLAAEKAP